MSLVSIPVEKDKELSLLNYIDEMDLTIKPVLNVLMDVDEETEIAHYKNLIWGAIQHWKQIDNFFMEHNRRATGKPVRKKIRKPISDVERNEIRKVMMKDGIDQLSMKDTEKAYNFFLSLSDKRPHTENEEIG